MNSINVYITNELLKKIEKKVSIEDLDLCLLSRKRMYFQTYDICIDLVNVNKSLLASTFSKIRLIDLPGKPTLVKWILTG